MDAEMRQPLTRGLLVDDDSSWLRVGKRLVEERLDDLGVPVELTTCESTEAARALLKGHPLGTYDLVLTDMYFPPLGEPEADRSDYEPLGLDLLGYARRRGVGVVVGYTDMQRPKLQEVRAQAAQFAPDLFCQRGDLSAREQVNNLGDIARLLKGKGPEMSSEPETARATDPRDVAVVFGANDKAREALFDFLGALDLRPVEFEDAAAWTKRGSAPISEILAGLFERTQAVVVLLTPDEEVNLRSELAAQRGSNEAGLQARPNVYLEAGMALAANPNRTVLVRLGSTRPASDLDGLFALVLDDSPEAREKLAARLERAGCPVRRQQRMWRTPRSFLVTLDESSTTG